MKLTISPIPGHMFKISGLSTFWSTSNCIGRGHHCWSGPFTHWYCCHHHHLTVFQV